MKLPVPPYLLAVLLAALTFASLVYFVNDQFGTHLLSGMFGITLTVLVIDQLIRRENRTRWKKYSLKARDTVTEGVYDVFSDIAEITNVLLLMEPSKISENMPDDYLSSFDGQRLGALIALKDKGLDAVKKQVDEELVAGGYVSRLEADVSYLSDLETKYGAYLEPREISALLDLENNLRSLNNGVRQHRRTLDLSTKFGQTQTIPFDTMLEASEKMIYNGLSLLISNLETLSMVGLLNAKLPND